MNATTDERGLELHDRATRGAALTPVEREELEAWYARIDQEEMAALACARPPHDLPALREEVDSALARVLVVTERIRKLTAESEQMRREVAELQERVARSATAGSV
jgi:hypothetical protein